MIKNNLIGFLLLFVNTVWAADTYNPVNNQLSIPAVELNGIIYRDVVITVGNILSLSGGTPKKDIDKYDVAT